jgi:IPT/TIG domain
MKRLAVLSTSLVFALALSAAGAGAASAAAPPELGSFSISPGTVTITSSAQNVIVSAEITSTVGVSSASIGLESPHLSQSSGPVSFTKTSGTALKGIWEASVPIKQYSNTGTWHVTSVNLADTEGNQARLSATQLHEKAFPSTVAVQGTEDNEAPVLTALSFSPKNVDTTSSAATVTVTATITDNLSGLASASIGFRSPKGRFTTGHTTLTRISGTATSGTYEAQVTFPRYVERGVWNVSTLQLVDNVGNESVLIPVRLQAKGFPGAVTVEGTVEDAEPPAVTGLTIEPSSVNTTSSAQTVTVKAQLTDNLSGVAGGSIQFQSPNGKQFTSKATFSKVSGSELNGSWKAEVPFEQFTQAGTWKVSSMVLTDGVGNEAKLTGSQLEAKALPDNVSVTSTEDTEAPVLVSLALAPASVETTSSAQTVTATAEITDNASGFARGSIDFKAPTGEHITQPVSFVRVSGTATKGIYEAKATFKQYIQAGTWTVSDVSMVDAVGNEANITTAQLEAKAFPHSVAVTDTNEDREAPQLTALSISPTKVDTVTAAQHVLLTAHMTDNLSGVASATVLFENEAGTKLTNVEPFVRASGNELSGVYEAVATFKVSPESGRWRVRGLTMEDAVENTVSLTAAQLEGKGFPASVLDETEAPPNVRKVTPRKGPAAGGTTVTILGTNFTGTTAVMFGSFSAQSFTVNSANSMTAVSPAATAGTVQVTVTTTHGTNLGSGKARFKFGPPTISKISPETGPQSGGTHVTITGSGFALGSVMTLKFGAAAASSVNCTSTTSCTAVTPAVAKPGTVKVVASIAGAKHSKPLEASFTYN